MGQYAEDAINEGWDDWNELMENIEVECSDCGWQGNKNELVSRHPYLKECDYEYCPRCESDNIVEL